MTLVVALQKASGPRPEECDYGSCCLAAGPVRARLGEPLRLPGIHRSLCADLSAAMIYVTAVIAALLFAYLGTALVRPEWF